MISKPICLIIGAGDYIGAAIAKRFAKGGFHIVMGRRRVEKLVPVIAEIEALLAELMAMNQRKDQYVGEGGAQGRAAAARPAAPERSGGVAVPPLHQVERRGD